MDFPFFYEDGLGKIVNKNGVDPMDVESDNEGEDVQVETLISLNSYLDNQRQQQKQNEEQQQQQQQREQQVGRIEEEREKNEKKVTKKRVNNVYAERDYDRFMD